MVIVYFSYALVGLLLAFVSSKMKLKKTSYLFYVGATIEVICTIVMLIDGSFSNDLGAALWSILVVIPLYFIGVVSLIISFIKRKRKK